MVLFESSDKVYKGFGIEYIDREESVGLNTRLIEILSYVDSIAHVMEEKDGLYQAPWPKEWVLMSMR